MMTGIEGGNLGQFRAEAKGLLVKSLMQHPGKGARVGGKSPAADRVTLGNGKTGAVTYGASMKGIDLDAQYEKLLHKVTDLFQEQGVAVKVATDEGEIDISSLTPVEAQGLIADDGYFGVDKTSQRIFDFAVGLAGNDPERIEQVMRGVKDGFMQAEAAWGGALPEISYQTRDAVFEKFDRWLEGLAGRE